MFHASTASKNWRPSFLNRDRNEEQPAEEQIHTRPAFLDNLPAQMQAEEEEVQAKENAAQMQEEEEELQMKAAPAQGAKDEELMQGKAVQKKSPTQLKKNGTSPGMPSHVQAKMEGSFGTDFSNVNIHANDNSATQMGALAYTRGNDVHFAPGQYNPGSQKGQELLGHELTHVVQQRQGRVAPTKQGKGMPVNDSPTLEKEADDMGAKAVRGSEVQVLGASSGIQNKEATSFTVPSGWGLTKIAEHFNVNIEELKDANQDQLKTWGSVNGFLAGAVINIPHTSSSNTSNETTKTPTEIISEGYNNFVSGDITMPNLAAILLPYASSNTNDILDVFGKLKWNVRDNLAYTIAVASSDSELACFDEALLKKMHTELGGFINTTSWSENWEQQERIGKILNPQEQIVNAIVSSDDSVAEDLEFLRSNFNNNLSGAVGNGKDNAPLDVQLVARGLADKDYNVPQSALNEGDCSEELIEVIKKFQEEVVEIDNPDGVIDVNGGTIKKLFDKNNNSYSSGLSNMFGQSAGTLNQSLEGNPLATWKRAETFNNTTNVYDYSINDTNFHEQTTYKEYIEKLAEAKGVEKDSDNAEALGMAAKAASDNSYFSKITENVGFELKLSNESVGSHQVNSVLKHRLTKFHKFLSAIGLFKGNMTGSACRDAAYAHLISVAHVVIGNVRPQASKNSVRNNLIDVYNGETKAGGTKAANGNILDSDGHIWAKPEHFNTDESGIATSLNDDVWFPHLKTPQPDRNWNVYTAEGYKKGDNKRFPLGLNAIPGRSNHITGDAIDVNASNFANKNDAMIDLIALNFGLIRPVPGEQWHFECTNVKISSSEKALIEANTRESLN